MSKLCEKWEKKQKDTGGNTNFDVNDEKSLKQFGEIVELNEDKEGEILTMIGKAKIMLEKKGRLRQFQDLIKNCEFGYGEKKTNCSDLQGFWEMISFEVNKIEGGFSNLAKLEENGWISVQTFSKKESDFEKKTINAINRKSSNMKTKNF